MSLGNDEKKELTKYLLNGLGFLRRKKKNWAEVAAYLKVSVRTIHRWREGKEINEFFLCTLNNKFQTDGIFNEISETEYKREKDE